MRFFDACAVFLVVIIFMLQYSKDVKKQTSCRVRENQLFYCKCNVERCLHKVIKHGIVYSSDSRGHL